MSLSEKTKAFTDNKGFISCLHSKKKIQKKNMDPKIRLEQETHFNRWINQTLFHINGTL